MQNAIASLKYSCMLTGDHTRSERWKHNIFDKCILLYTYTTTKHVFDIKLKLNECKCVTKRITEIVQQAPNFYKTSEMSQKNIKTLKICVVLLIPRSAVSPRTTMLNPTTTKPNKIPVSVRRCISMPECFYVFVYIFAYVCVYVCLSVCRYACASQSGLVF